MDTEEEGMRERRVLDDECNRRQRDVLTIRECKQSITNLF